MWRIAADPWYDVDITEKNHSEIHVEDINLKEGQLKKAAKKEKAIVKAYCLGEENPVLDDMEEKGLIRKDEGDIWRIFSQEATDGELAHNGDYIKIDSKGRPYPNSRAFFMENHRRLSENGDEYEQIPKARYVWSLSFGDEMCSEIQFLIEHKELTINEQDEKQYFRAPLWGDMQTTPKDSVIMLDEVKYGEPDETGKREVMDAVFWFVAFDEFQRTYQLLTDTL